MKETTDKVKYPELARAENVCGAAITILVRAQRLRPRALSQSGINRKPRKLITESLQLGLTFHCSS